MNIFVLSEDPVEAAKMQCDKHVVKMCLETAQILSTIVGGPYKPTHTNHPCTLWAKKSRANFNWLLTHGFALCAEYAERYKKTHKSYSVLLVVEDTAMQFAESQLTPFAQCMPDQYKRQSTVEAYRAYYHSKSFAAWRHTAPPDWWVPV